MSDPIIPMSPDALPQQRLHLVVDLPPLPAGFDVNHLDAGPANDAARRHALPVAELPDRYPGAATYLFQAEWASSPMHNWINAYALSANRSKSHWLLWRRTLDDESPRWRWESEVIATVPWVTSDRHVAGIWLVAEALRIEADEGWTERPDWINECGDLSIHELAAIFRYVWERGDDEW